MLRFRVKNPERTLRAIALFRYGMSALFLLLAAVREEKALFLGLSLLAFLMARSGFCPLVQAPKKGHP
ncbi:hypothetical protein Theos_1147 [Thermus oshimai JL-2]|uniref:DUF2892 domain-containing protein n=1 Tax=Thermus oshimai JL-2 TaxID=751945 RepID=K7QZA9_THEOS|nr:hypothetical protein [Thermus oshimai]AFV76190.1 hypothetical protein Theos_1147 [Thermus oshimai JL-2]